MSNSQGLADFFSNLELDDLPADVLAEGRRLLIDTIGCTVAATRTEAARLAQGGRGAFSPSDAAPLIGLNERASLFEAAYVNARMANALDFDETFPVGVHFGVGAVVAPIVLANQYDLTGADVLLSIIVGYEVGARLATAIGPMVHTVGGAVTGFPSVWGVAAPVAVAAAAATARSLNFGGRSFVQALTLAAGNAPLPVGAQWETSVDLPNCKYCDAGWCTGAGLFAAFLAESGTTGFPNILESDRGIARMYGQNPNNIHHLFDGLGTRWFLRDITYKPWPTCRFTHAPLTALGRVLTTHRIDPDQIERIVVETNPLAISERFTQKVPKTFASKQFSYPHMVALQVLGVPAGDLWFQDHWEADPLYRHLRDRTEIVLHPRATEFAAHFRDNQFRQMPGGVRVTAGGRDYAGESDFALGDPWTSDTRISDQQLDEKFRRLVGATTSDDVLPRLWRIESESDVDGILARLSSPAAEKETA